LRRVQKQSTRVSRTPLAEMPTGPPDLKSSETSTIEHPPSGVTSKDHSQKRTRQFIVLATMIVVLLVAFVAYTFFFSKRQSIDSIAELPFENVGADPNTEYLSDGITKSLINTLSHLSNLTVMSRSSLFHFKGKAIDPQKAGKELGVKAVLTGRVIQHGDNLQISTELVDVSNNTHVWGEQYSKKLSDILSVQETISKEIYQQLSLKLVGEDEKKLAKRSTENTEAYQFYLKGRFYWNKRNSDDLQRAVDYFKQAIEKDPSYALAYAGLASTYAVLPEYSGLAAIGFISKTETAARRALELDATLAEPHAALGLIKYSYQWYWQDADREFMRAIELDPNNPTTHHWYSNSLENQGKLQEALSEIKRAQELDPLSPVIANNVGEILAYMQHYDLATEQLNKALELDPNQPGLHGTIAFVHLQQGRLNEAITELEKTRQIVGANSPYALGDLGYAYVKAGKKAEAIRNLDQLLEFSKHGYMVAVQRASVYVGLGNAEKAFEWLDKGYNEHNTQLSYLKIDPVWQSLRSDARYAALLKKIGLEK